MNQTTVGRVLTWLAEATGKDAACDRPFLVDLLNDIRQLAYSNAQVLQHAKPSYLCVPVQCFCSTCDVGSCGCQASGQPWAGITLPQWMHQATVLFRRDGIAMPYVTRWTSYNVHPGERVKEMTWQDMGDTYVLEKDPPCSEPFLLEFMATVCGANQAVTISYLDDLKKPVTESVTLKQGEWVGLSQKVSSLLPSGVRVPLDLRGPIRVRAAGVQVAQWEPGIDVPAFRRIRLTGSCQCENGGTVAVKGIRRFSRLWDDHDIVEHDNRTAWVAGAHFIRTVNQSEMDQAQIANAMFKKNLFDGFIASEATAEDTGHRRSVPLAQTFNRPGPLGM
jgi:hypothetical protein